MVTPSAHVPAVERGFSNLSFSLQLPADAPGRAGEGSPGAQRPPPPRGRPGCSSWLPGQPGPAPATAGPGGVAPRVGALCPSPSASPIQASRWTGDLSPPAGHRALATVCPRLGAALPLSVSSFAASALPAGASGSQQVTGLRFTFSGRRSARPLPFHQPHSPGTASKQRQPHVSPRTGEGAFKNVWEIQTVTTLRPD